MTKIEKPRFSPLNRLACYNLTLQQFRTHKHGPWLCVVIASIAFQDQTIDLKIEFPELMTQKPPDREDGLIWWRCDPEGNACREKALLEAIRLVKIEIEKGLTL